MLTAEHILGADLIYERYNMNTEKVRMAVLQYKVWNDNDVLYYGNADQRDLKQMQKMHDKLCAKNMCVMNKLDGLIDYLFPYCCAFLRPTDRLQNPQSKMISSGIHIPMCSAIEMALKDKKIEKNAIRTAALTHDVFEYLFNHNFIGSKSMTTDELDIFYKELEIFEGSRTIMIYAKEVILPKKMTH